MQGLWPLLSAGHAFGQSRKLALTAVRLPDNPAVVEQTKDRAARRAAQGLDAVAGVERGGFAEAFDDANHAIPVEHAGNVVGDGGDHLTAPTGGQVGKQSGSELSSNIREGITVEEEKWGTPMAVPEEI